MALRALYRSSATGFVIWGSSADVNTPDKCRDLLKYVETVLGPEIAKYTRPDSLVEVLNNTQIYTDDEVIFVLTDKPADTENSNDTLSIRNQTDVDEDETKIENYRRKSSFSDVGILTSTTEIGPFVSDDTDHSTKTTEVIPTSRIITILSTNNDKDVTTSSATEEAVLTTEPSTVKGDSSTTINVDPTTQTATSTMKYDDDDTYIASDENDEVFFNEEDFFGTDSKNYDLSKSTVPSTTDFTEINEGANDQNLPAIEETTTTSLRITESHFSKAAHTIHSPHIFHINKDKTATSVLKESITEIDSIRESLNTRPEPTMEPILDTYFTISPKAKTPNILFNSTSMPTLKNDETTPVLLENVAESTYLTETTKLRTNERKSSLTEMNETFEDNEGGDPTSMGLTSAIDKVVL